MDDALAAELPGLLHHTPVPGIAVALVREAAVAWVGACGLADSRSAQPLTTATVFQAASLSKPLFAYAVLGLVERGVLDLDAPLTAYLPQPYAPGDPLLSVITARLVLCHMTGWPNWRPEGAPLVRERAPGEAFGYSGEGYNYLQAVVEHLVGQPLDVYMREAVLYPLGMAASSYNWATPGAAGVAAAHDRQGQPVHPYVGERPEAASSLHSTAGEYARFLCAMLDSSDSALPLHRDSLAEMVRPHVRITGALAWGLGWGLEDTGEGIVLWHWGDNPGFKHLAMIAPRTKTGVAIMTNGDAGLLPCEQLVARTIGGTHPALAWLARDFYGVSDFLSL